MPVPQTRYAETADGLHIAYQVVGAGPVDVVVVGAWMSNVEATWDLTVNREVFERFGSFARVAIFDKRGVGLSDHVPAGRPPRLEDSLADITAVLDANAWPSATLFAAGEGTALALTFASAHPERTAALVVVNGYARFTHAPDYPWGAPERSVDAIRERFRREWGAGTLTLSAGVGLDEAVVLDELARLERMMASPGTAAALVGLQYGVDVRQVLPTVRAPTLVLHRRDNRFVRPGHGRYLADRIPGARYVELPGEHHLWNYDFEPVAEEVEEFLTGVRGTSASVLATMLFVDIVGSTDRTAQVGDRRWRGLLDHFDALVGRELRRFGGRAVNARGDDQLAVFDSPSRAVRCALAITSGVADLGIRVRTGLHAGEVVPRDRDVSGLAVDIAARVCALAGPDEVLVSQTVADLVVGSGIAFRDAGDHELKGVPGRWTLLAVARDAP